jgi:hypothetical protein
MVSSIDPSCGSCRHLGSILGHTRWRQGEVPLVNVATDNVTPGKIRVWKDATEVWQQSDMQDISQLIYHDPTISIIFLSRDSQLYKSKFLSWILFGNLCELPLNNSPMFRTASCPNYVHLNDHLFVVSLHVTSCIRRLQSRCAGFESWSNH